MSLYDPFTHQLLQAETERRAAVNAEAARRLAGATADASAPRGGRPRRPLLRRSLLPGPRGYRMAR
jgi:hypothetical protein